MALNLAVVKSLPQLFGGFLNKLTSKKAGASTTEAVGSGLKQL